MLIVVRSCDRDRFAPKRGESGIRLALRGIMHVSLKTQRRRSRYGGQGDGQRGWYDNARSRPPTCWRSMPDGYQ